MLVFDPKEDNEDFFYHGQKQQRRDLNKKANRDQKFAFDVVFGPNATNEDVYAGTTKGVTFWDQCISKFPLTPNFDKITTLPSLFKSEFI